jgi:hypothetical protein
VTCRCVVCHKVALWDADDGFLCEDHWSLVPKAKRTEYLRACQRFRQERAGRPASSPERERAYEKAVAVMADVKAAVRAR